MWFPIYLSLLTDSVLNITELMKRGEQNEFNVPEWFHYKEGFYLKKSFNSSFRGVRHGITGEGRNSCY